MTLYSTVAIDANYWWISHSVVDKCLGIHSQSTIVLRLPQAKGAENGYSSFTMLAGNIGKFILLMCYSFGMGCSSDHLLRFEWRQSVCASTLVRFLFRRCTIYPKCTCSYLVLIFWCAAASELGFWIHFLGFNKDNQFTFQPWSGSSSEGV